jgi:hypothetical protein
MAFCFFFFVGSEATELFLSLLENEVDGGDFCESADGRTGDDVDTELAVNWRSTGTTSLIVAAEVEELCEVIDV